MCSYMIFYFLRTFTSKNIIIYIVFLMEPHAFILYKHHDKKKTRHVNLEFRITYANIQILLNKGGLTDIWILFSWNMVMQVYTLFVIHAIKSIPLFRMNNQSLLQWKPSMVWIIFWFFFHKNTGQAFEVRDINENVFYSWRNIWF